VLKKMALPQQSMNNSEEIVFEADDKTIENAKVSRSFEIPNDDYMVKIEKVEPTKSQEGKKMLKITYTIQGDDEPCKGLHVWDNLPMEGRGFPDMLLQRCAAANYAINRGNDNRIHIVPSELEGLYLGVTVQNKEYPIGSGKKYPKVAKVINLKEGQQKPTTPGEM
jgi:hypothetical protein